MQRPLTFLSVQSFCASSVLDIDSKTGRINCQRLFECYIKSNPSILFRKSYCGYSNAAAAHLRERKVAFKELDLDSSQFQSMILSAAQSLNADAKVSLDTETLMDDLLAVTSKHGGRRTVPQYFVDGKYVGNGDKVRSL